MTAVIVAAMLYHRGGGKYVTLSVELCVLGYALVWVDGAGRGRGRHIRARRGKCDAAGLEPAAVAVASLGPKMARFFLV